mmetsp:Transcript_37882/g.42428  ORF Transcript_37882/g.42428 Transcript_37882/m.42428 type:complete len:172 (-) Transcript_37882:2510-3025(-)
MIAPNISQMYGKQTKSIVMDSSRPSSGSVVAHPVRINAGEDLVSSMELAALAAMEKSETSSAFVLTAVGSLESVTLRMANSCKRENGSCINNLKEWKQRLEIVSLVGTFSRDGKHLHMTVSDKDGNVFGGHLMSGKIFTTLEIVIGVIENVKFSRVYDPATGYKELAVNPK